MRYSSSTNRTNMLHMLLRPASDSGRFRTEENHLLPLRALAPREREVAQIVYEAGACTANQVQTQLSVSLSNGAVRSMLVRLVRKGIIFRRWGRRGRGQEHVYMPAITPAAVKERVLLEVTEKYFSGSMIATALGALDLLDSDTRDSLLCSLEAKPEERQ